MPGKRCWSWSAGQHQHWDPGVRVDSTLGKDPCQSWCMTLYWLLVEILEFQSTFLCVLLSDWFPLNVPNDLYFDLMSNKTSSASSASSDQVVCKRSSKVWTCSSVLVLSHTAAMSVRTYVCGPPVRDVQTLKKSADCWCQQACDLTIGVRGVKMGVRGRMGGDEVND